MNNNTEENINMPSSPSLSARLQGHVSKLFLDYIRRMCTSVWLNISDEQLKSYTRHMKHMESMMCNLREYATEQNDTAMQLELNELENQMKVYKDRMNH